MSASFTFLYSSVEVEEPKEITNGASFIVTIRNTGDEIGTELGLYIRPATDNGDIDYPSESSNQTNYYRVVKDGNSGYGIAVTQGVTTTRIDDSTGCFFSNKIPLTIGSGTAGDQLEVGAEVQVTITFTLPPAAASTNIYVDIVLE